MNLDLNNNKKSQGLGDNKLKLLVLPNFDLKALNFAKEQISKTSELVTTAVLPLVANKQTENAFWKVLRDVKETAYNISYKTAQLFGLESWIEKSAELLKNIFKIISNLFTVNSSLGEDKKPEINITTNSNNSAFNFTSKNSSAEDQKNNCTSQRGLFGLDSFKNLEKDKNKEEQALVDMLIKFGGKAIDRAQRSYFKLALTLNHFRNPELAKVEKLIAETEKS